MSTKSQIDIVLPCFNPGNSWQHELEKFYQAASNSYHLHFIVVNDGSTISNPVPQIEFLQKQNISLSYFEYPVNKGKGYALRYGVAKSSAPFVVYTDIDFPFTNESMLNLISVLTNTETDVVVGHRSESYYRQKMSWFRKSLSQTFRVFIKRFLNMRITDTQCGLKGFNEKGNPSFFKPPSIVISSILNLFTPSATT
ncbi:MAG: glycosyltransferase, partial [Bacteroidota bacterium]